jgi:hypothetical protein
MDGPIPRRLRGGHIIFDLVGLGVAPEAVPTEPLYNPLDLLLGVEHGSNTSDVLHPGQIHLGESSEFVLNGGNSL